MGLSVEVNGLTLCHRGSGGVVDNTLPDVCKTPDKGIPVPYGNRAFSKDLANGTTTCFADGGNMIANYGSIFAQSIFDEGGSMGGIVSGTNKAEAEWISFSPDVFFEGKPACRHTDKMFMNHRNTVSLGGMMQAPLEAWPELMALCGIVCSCDAVPLPSRSGASELRQECVEKAVIALDDAAGGRSPMKAEIPYNMTTEPPTPIVSRELLDQSGVLRATQYLPRRMKEMGLNAARFNPGGAYDVRIPDVVITRTPNDLSGRSLTAPNLKAVVEIKFDEARDPEQILDYQDIAGPPENRVVELSPQECLCDLPDGERVPALERVRQPAVEPEDDRGLLDRFGDALHDSTGLRLTGAALIAALVISELSRLYLPRNAVPIP